MADSTTSSEATAAPAAEAPATSSPETTSQVGSGDILATFRKDNKELASRNADLEKQLASLSKSKGKLEEELTELRTAAEKAAKQGRENTLLSSLYKQSSQSEFLVRAAYLGAVADGKLERFPENPEEAAEQAVKVLEELEPGLFGSRPSIPSVSKPIALVGGGVPQSAPPKISKTNQLPGLLSSAWGAKSKDG